MERDRWQGGEIGRCGKIGGGAKGYGAVMAAQAEPGGPQRLEGFGLDGRGFIRGIVVGGIFLADPQRPRILQIGKLCGVMGSMAENTDPLLGGLYPPRTAGGKVVRRIEDTHGVHSVCQGKNSKDRSR